eukprot:358867-Chlamydomonas_euryale.AAC.1
MRVTSAHTWSTPTQLAAGDTWAAHRGRRLCRGLHWALRRHFDCRKTAFRARRRCGCIYVLGGGMYVANSVPTHICRIFEGRSFGVGGARMVRFQKEGTVGKLFTRRSRFNSHILKITNQNFRV